ncbi:MAG: hypothetical protein HGA78_04425 [Nitrospirales bacterium]|nr:hypothetical protein [Nitrospirales bacterium]
MKGIILASRSGTRLYPVPKADTISDPMPFHFRKLALPDVVPVKPGNIALIF